MKDPNKIWGDMVKYRVFNTDLIKNYDLSIFSQAIVKDPGGKVTTGTLKNLQRASGYDTQVSENNQRYITETKRKINNSSSFNDISSFRVDNTYLDDTRKEVVEHIRSVYYPKVKGEIEMARSVDELGKVKRNINYEYVKNKGTINYKFKGRNRDLTLKSEVFGKNYEDLRRGSFGSSIRRNRVSKQFMNFYSLDENEARQIINKLHNEYLEEQKKLDKEKEEREQERREERERKEAEKEEEKQRVTEEMEQRRLEEEQERQQRKEESEAEKR